MGKYRWMGDDHWLEKRARRSKKGKKQSGVHEDSAVLIETRRRTVRDRREELRSSLWFAKYSGQLSALESRLDSVRTVLCLGLGRISTERNAQLQWALLMETPAFGPLDKLYYYDPVFDDTDRLLLSESEEIDVGILQNDEEVADLIRRAIASEDRGPQTKPSLLLYMPHCDLTLYESTLALLMSGDRGALENVLLLANNLKRYLETKSDRQLAPFPSLTRTVSHSSWQVTEMLQPLPSDYYAPFVDLAWQWWDSEGGAERDTCCKEKDTSS